MFHTYYVTFSDSLTVFLAQNFKTEVSTAQKKINFSNFWSGIQQFYNLCLCSLCTDVAICILWNMCTLCNFAYTMYTQMCTINTLPSWLYSADWIIWPGDKRYGIHPTSPPLEQAQRWLLSSPGGMAKMLAAVYGRSWKTVSSIYFTYACTVYTFIIGAVDRNNFTFLYFEGSAHCIA